MWLNCGESGTRDKPITLPITMKSTNYLAMMTFEWIGGHFAGNNAWDPFAKEKTLTTFTWSVMGISGACSSNLALFIDF